MSADSPFARESHAWWVVYVAAAAAIGCLCLIVLGPLMGDSVRYITIATNLAAGHGYSSASAAPYGPEVFRAPLYPMFLALILSSGLGIYAVVACQLAIYIASIVLVRRLALMIHGDVLAAQLVGLILAVHAPILRWVVQLGAESLMLFLFCATVLLLVRHLGTPQWSSAVALGVLAGAIFLTRTDYVLLVGLVPIVVAVRHHSGRALRQTIVLTGIVCVLAGGWMVRNTIVVPGGHRPLGVGGWMALWARAVETVEPDAATRERIVLSNPHVRTIHGVSDPSAALAAEQALGREARAILSRHVGAWGLGSVYKLTLRYWVERYDPRMPALVGWLAGVWSGGLLLLAYLGIAALWRRAHALPQVLLAVMAVSVLHAVITIEARYSAPLRPVVLIFSAWSLAAGARAIGRRLPSRAPAIR